MRGLEWSRRGGTTAEVAAEAEAEFLHFLLFLLSLLLLQHLILLFHFLHVILKIKTSHNSLLFSSSDFTPFSFFSSSSSDDPLFLIPPSLPPPIPFSFLILNPFLPRVVIIAAVTKIVAIRAWRYRKNLLQIIVTTSSSLSSLSFFVHHRHRIVVVIVAIFVLTTQYRRLAFVFRLPLSSSTTLIIAELIRS